MDAGLYIYFPRDPAQNIYFKVFDIYFKKMPAPSESTVRPLTKKGTTFNHSPIVPTAILNTKLCPTGFGLVVLNACQIEFFKR